MKIRLLGFGIIAAVAVSGYAFAEKAPAPNPAELLEQRCSVCHPSSRAKGVKKSPEQWAATVKRMQGKGAKLNDIERKSLEEYLSKTFKP
jgi:hypothetical protein